MSLLLTTACSSTPTGNAPATSPATDSIDFGTPSAETPLSPETVAAAEREGSVLIYGNANDDMLRPVVDAFQAKHPTITVRYLSLDGAEVFSRYQSEAAVRSPTADLLIENSGTRWLDLIRKGGVADYQDPNLPNLPDYARVAPGVTATSMGSVVAVFNKALVPEDQQPRTLADFAAFAERYKGRIGTYTIDNELGYAAVDGYLSRHGEEGWSVLQKLGAAAKTESGSGAMMQKLAQGAYVAVYNASDAVVPLIVEPNSQLLEARHLTDNTVILPQSIGLTTAARSPNAAKLFLNYLLSVEGQQVACNSGFSAYRAGVKCAYGLAATAAEVGGEQNVIFSEYTPGLAERRPSISARWKSLFQAN